MFMLGYRVRPRRALLLVALASLTAAGGCTADDEVVATEAPSTARDAGAPSANDSSSTSDSGSPTAPRNDASAPADACGDGGCTPPSGCAAHLAADFCDDFDSADALTPGKTKWDVLEMSTQPVATLSSLRAVSAPSSLLSQIIDRDTPGARFAKTITKNAFTEATWEYNVYFDSIGASDGFFLDDFQFSDATGPDTFGFRLVMFAKEGAIEKLGVEHNAQAIAGPYDIEPPIADGTVQLGKWHHFKQKVSFVFAPDGGDATGNRATYSLWVDGATAPAVTKEYPGPSRAQATFARAAGLALVFNKERSAGLKIHWDNHVLEMK